MWTEAGIRSRVGHGWQPRSGSGSGCRLNSVVHSWKLPGGAFIVPEAGSRLQPCKGSSNAGAKPVLSPVVRVKHAFLCLLWVGPPAALCEEAARPGV